MIEDSPDQLRQEVESQHGGTATLLQAVPVHETRDGQTIWDGMVSIFELRGSSSGAFRAYAWFYELSDGKRRFFSVLHSPKIDNPRNAVRSAIGAEHEARK